MIGQNTRFAYGPDAQRAAERSHVLQEVTVRTRSARRRPVHRARSPDAAVDDNFADASRVLSGGERNRVQLAKLCARARTSSSSTSDERSRRDTLGVLEEALAESGLRLIVSTTAGSSTRSRPASSRSRTTAGHVLRGQLLGLPRRVRRARRRRRGRRCRRRRRGAPCPARLRHRRPRRRRGGARSRRAGARGDGGRDRGGRANGRELEAALQDPRAYSSARPSPGARRPARRGPSRSRACTRGGKSSSGSAERDGLAGRARRESASERTWTGLPARCLDVGVRGHVRPAAPLAVLPGPGSRSEHEPDDGRGARRRIVVVGLGEASKNRAGRWREEPDRQHRDRGHQVWPSLARRSEQLDERGRVRSGAVGSSPEVRATGVRVPPPPVG